MLNKKQKNKNKKDTQFMVIDKYAADKEKKVHPSNHPITTTTT